MREGFRVVKDLALLGLWGLVPSAGEVEQFAYCAHNWWLARGGVEGVGPGVSRGMREHSQKGRAQQQAEGVRKSAREAFRWMFRILAVAGSVAFLALELYFLRTDPFHWLFLLTALILVSASAGLLVIASVSEREYRTRVIKAGLVPGRVGRGGWEGQDVMQDPEWGISGSPDYVMETEGGPVPVEVKTGRTPDQPFPSHELQVACYLRLLEATDGSAPEYGLLTYPDGVFRVAWDDALKRRLRATLDAMAAAVAAGKADRDHDHVGRCVGCARRASCDQALG